MSEAVGTVEVDPGAVGSFEEFFEETYERLLRALFLVTGDPHEAEDVAQEAFVRVFERWETVRDHPNPGGYLFRTALNLYRSRIRRLRVAARRVLTSSPPDELAAAEDRDLLSRAMARLTRGQREAVVLVECLGLSDKEAAEVLGVAPVTVRVRLSRARDALRAEMGGEER
jgi:RNA polymerase sigma-70 factor (sigma-E family)